MPLAIPRHWATGGRASWYAARTRCRCVRPGGSTTSCHCLPAPRRARERRQKQEELDRTKKLGDAGEDVDDVLTWVSRNRQAQQKRAAEAEAAKRRAAEAAAARRGGRGSDDDEEDAFEVRGGGGMAAAGLQRRCLWSA